MSAGRRTCIPRGRRNRALSARTTPVPPRRSGAHRFATARSCRTSRPARGPCRLRGSSGRKRPVPGSPGPFLPPGPWSSIFSESRRNNHGKISESRFPKTFKTEANVFASTPYCVHPNRPVEYMMKDHRPIYNLYNEKWGAELGFAGRAPYVFSGHEFQGVYFRIISTLYLNGIRIQTKIGYLHP